MKYIKSTFIFLLSFTMVSMSACANSQADVNSKRKEETETRTIAPIDTLQLKITIGNKVVYTDFINSKTTQEFVKLLPLTLSMQDLNGREKYSSLSKNLSKDGNIKTTFEEGDISYWLGGGLAIFYHQDNSVIKAGLINIAKLKQGKENFVGSNTIDIKFEAVKKTK